jgi:hypothetical protein
MMMDLQKIYSCKDPWRICFLNSTSYYVQNYYIYKICENSTHICEIFYQALEKITLERDSHKERQIPELAWIYGLPGSGKTEFSQNYLKTYDFMKK